MTEITKLSPELQRNILFFSTPPYTTLRVSKLWCNLTKDIYYERLLKNLFRHRIAIEGGESYKQKFDLAWTTHFASCFQQKQLDEQLIEMHELIEVPDADFGADIGDNANIGYASDTEDSEYLSKISPVVTKLKELHIPFSNEDKIEKLNLYFAIEAEAYLRKYGNDLKNMDKLLIYYSGRGGLEAVKYLVLKGADPHRACIAITESDGRTYDFNPLQMATWLGWMPIMKYLIEECHADINWKNARGETVLSEATRDSRGINLNREERIKYLLAHGLKPTAKDLEVIADEILVGRSVQFLPVYRDIMNVCIARMSEAVDRSIKKNIMSEAEVQKMYKDFFNNLQQLELPDIILTVLAKHPLVFQAEQNRITPEDLGVFFEEMEKIVNSQGYLSDDEEVYLSDDEEVYRSDNEEEMRNNFLIYNFYIPIIKSFQSAENKLEAEYKQKLEEAEVDALAEDIEKVLEKESEKELHSSCYRP